MAQLDRCLAALREPLFAELLWTDRLEIRGVADRIAAATGLTLSPNTDGALRGRLRRSWISARHIRIG